jgi:hypothetical protein
MTRMAKVLSHINQVLDFKPAFLTFMGQMLTQCFSYSFGAI